MNQREETFKRRLEREVERRKKAEEKLKYTVTQFNNMTEAHPTKYVVVGGPDYEVLIFLSS